MRFLRQRDENDSQDIADGHAPLSSYAADPSYQQVQGHELSYPAQHQQYPHYAPGQPLEPIITGETLQIEEDNAAYANANGYHYSNQTPASSSYRNSGEGYTYQNGYDSPVYSSSSGQYGGVSLVSGSSYVNHFDHDTEAYASGINSLSVYRPPRSRSPTPAVDDEDYHIVGDTSIHYTGTESRSHGVSSNYTGEETYYTGAETNYSGKDSEDDEDDEDEVSDHLQPEGYDYQYSQNPFSEKGAAYSFVDMQRRGSHTASTSSGSFAEPITPYETRHFGPAPIGRVTRRHKEKKRVPLTRGNLVIDIPIPSRLVLPRRGEREMRYTRYTAATCDPDEFEQRGFYLRQIENGRRTELFIVITLYNEDEILFCRTLYAVMQNIAHLTTRKNSQTWGPDAWKKVVVCIVADGRRKIHPRVLDCLSLLGVYQEGGFMKSGINMKETQAHIFEYTTTFGLDSDLKFRFPDKGVVPTQIIFCMKEKNLKKINSHRWFFNAFAPQLQPNVCILLDVGTMPGKNSLYKLWKTFDLNSNVAGACGEIAVFKGKAWSLLLNPLVAAQNFEYKISNILDKPTESMFGYISVLPGAFSAYRYIALKNDKEGKGPLASYFKGEVLHGRDTDIFTSNMYLAEDRILCFELVAKANSSWVLKYVKGAIAETDVPDGLPEFISQRRRWLNGSFFAAVYAIAHVGQIMRAGHSITRKIALLIETFYTILNLTFAWFAIGNFFLFFVIVTSALEDPGFNLPWVKYVNTPMQYLLGSIVVACFLFSMGNRPRASPWKYKSASLVFAVLIIYLVFASAMCAVAAARQGGSTNSVMLFSIIITFGLYAASSLLAFDPWHIITSSLAYLLLSPTFINILSIYAFSNLDDMSWGTKQDSVPEIEDLGAVVQDSQAKVEVETTDTIDRNAAYDEAIQNLKYRKPVAPKQSSAAMTEAEREQKAKDYYANVRTNVLLLWALSNGVLLVAILGSGSPSQTMAPNSDGSNITKSYMVFILVFTALTNIIRFFASTLYLLIVFITG